jgi:multidrug resistance efflux pump
MADLYDIFLQQKASLEQQINDAATNLANQKAQYEADLTTDYNTQKQVLSKEVEAAGDMLLQAQAQAQPIVINAEQKTPWTLIGGLVFLSYIIFKRR